MSATMGEVFAHVVRDPIQSSNSLVIASDTPLSAEARARGAAADGAAAAGRAERRADRGPRCAAATSSPTTARRSSG